MKSAKFTNVLLSIIAICLILLIIEAYTGRPVKAQQMEVYITGGNLNSIHEPVEVVNHSTRKRGEFKYFEHIVPLHIEQPDGAEVSG